MVESGINLSDEDLVSLVEFFEVLFEIDQNNKKVPY
jgi:hypothetical protein